MSNDADEQLLETVILKVKNRLENGCSIEKKYKYLKHLDKLDIDFGILRSTGIGKTVNALRKEDGPIGEKATGLVVKWKDIAEAFNKTAPSNTDKSSNVNKVKQQNITSISSKQQIPHKDIRNLIVNHEEVSSKKYEKIPQKDIRNISDEYVTPSSNRKNESPIKKEVNGIKHSSKTSHQKEDHKSLKKNKENEEQESENSNEDENESKFKNASFADMLMMPMVQMKKKKKKSSSKDSSLKKAKIAMPSLPDIDLPDLKPEPVYQPSRPIPPPPPVVKNPPVKKKVQYNDSPIYADIVSRKSRSQMYTGKKVCNGIVVSLYQQCMRVLIENVDSLYDTGGVPFSIMKPLLSKCNPYDLERLEEHNPHFVEDEESDGLWKVHCQKEFRGREPDEMETWRELFRRLCDEREVRLQKLSTRITANQAAKVPERSVKLAYVSTGPKGSPQVMRRQKKHGTGSNKIAERKKELKEKLNTSDDAVPVPFTNVPRRDRCMKRPPTSLNHGGSSHQSSPPKKQKEELGTKGPAHLMPVTKKPAKKPMMAAALKSMKNYKHRMASSIMRK